MPVFQLSSEYTQGSVVLSASGNGGLSKNGGSTGSTGTGSRLHDDVSILYDSILTPRSSIVPAQLHSINPALSKNLYCSKHRNAGTAGFTDSDENSEHADSGRGDSDQEFGQKNKLGPKCSRQCLKFGHSDACWIDGLPATALPSEINISSISLAYDNRQNGLLTTPGRFIEANSSGYISEDSREQKVLRALLQSTPKKAPKKPASMSSGSESLVISTKDGCVINVQGSSRANEGFTVKECPSPTKINIV
jgi:hypothetical protein